MKLKSNYKMMNTDSFQITAVPFSFDRGKTVKDPSILFLSLPYQISLLVSVTKTDLSDRRPISI